MEDKIKLLLEYMKKEKESLYESEKEYDDSITPKDYRAGYLATVDKIKTFIGYRNIRVEEAWFNKLHRGDNSTEIEEKIADYDEERSKRHSKALDSMIGMNEFAENCNLPKFYEGEILSGAEINNYRNIDVRKKETDFFLQFIDKLSRTPGILIRKYMEEINMNIEESEEELKFIQELQRNIDDVDNKYGVEKNLTEDDGDIKFKDDDMMLGLER